MQFSFHKTMAIVPNTELKCRQNGGYHYDVFVLNDNTSKDSPSNMKAFLFYSFLSERFFSAINRFELYNF